MLGEAINPSERLHRSNGRRCKCCHIYFWVIPAGDTQVKGEPSTSKRRNIAENDVEASSNDSEPELVAERRFLRSPYLAVQTLISVPKPREQVADAEALLNITNTDFGRQGRASTSAEDGYGCTRVGKCLILFFCGNILHMDFGDCFEAPMNREKFPKKVPFQLTRTLVKAMEVNGIRGNFCLICENVMQVLRKRKDNVTAMMEEDFFIILHDMLAEMEKATKLQPVPDAHVPVMKFKYQGISIDLLYARLGHLRWLNNIDWQTVQSLNGYRVADQILKLVPNVEIEQDAYGMLQCIPYPNEYVDTFKPCPHCAFFMGLQRKQGVKVEEGQKQIPSYVFPYGYKRSPLSRHANQQSERTSEEDAEGCRSHSAEKQLKWKRDSEMLGRDADSNHEVRPSTVVDYSETGYTKRVLNRKEGADDDNGELVKPCKHFARAENDKSAPGLNICVKNLSCEPTIALGMTAESQNGASSEPVQKPVMRHVF
ncbi:Serine/threonine-protein kinase TOR [Camellia lanceoleosa]|uniref:Serine/threonine-protein kinase TOR n=1 Tax=Camellia lanceoleosa TaxID=1840588 RepID=A0ACC0FNP8_9ERIC|nr:Serine/threonine-protein kinase TOR [Camellia lanceoleosa]